MSRFASAELLESYMGLTAGERSSSEKRRRLGITKAGPAIVRQMLTQACWNMRRTQSGSSLVRWGMEVEKRRGKQVAIVAMSRKLSGVLYAMWRDGRRYEADRAASAVPRRPRILE